MPHNDLTVLYEDHSLVLCVKPVGVLSEDSDSAASMPALLRAHYRSLHQPDYIATVHRLDKITGGLMLFSRSKAATGKLIAAVAEHRVEKEYLAVLRGHPDAPGGELTDLLFRDAAKNKSYVVKRMRKGVREAKLSYRVLAETEDLWSASASTPVVPTRYGCSFPPGVCPCWATSATAARTPIAPPPSGPIVWP